MYLFCPLSQWCDLKKDPNRKHRFILAIKDHKWKAYEEENDLNTKVKMTIEIQSSCSISGILFQLFDTHKKFDGLHFEEAVSSIIGKLIKITQISPRSIPLTITNGFDVGALIDKYYQTHLQRDTNGFINPKK